MNSSEDMVRSTIKQFLRAAALYARIEKLPIEIDEGVEITTREAHVIQAIGEQPQISVTAVATRFGVTKSAASQLTARLTRKGFVRKTRAPDNNKEWHLLLTESGWDALRAHERFHGRDLAEIVNRLGAFPADKVEGMSAVLEVVERVMVARLEKR